MTSLYQCKKSYCPTVINLRQWRRVNRMSHQVTDEMYVIMVLYMSSTPLITDSNNLDWLILSCNVINYSVHVLPFEYVRRNEFLRTVFWLVCLWKHCTKHLKYILLNVDSISDDRAHRNLQICVKNWRNMRSSPMHIPPFSTIGHRGFGHKPSGHSQLVTVIWSHPIAHNDLVTVIWSQPVGHIHLVTVNWSQ